MSNSIIQKYKYQIYYNVIIIDDNIKMPIPKPNKQESKDDYVSNFMSNEAMKREYALKQLSRKEKENLIILN